MSILTIIIALIESMLGNTGLSLLFVGITLPIEILITVLFWTLFLYNPTLLMSKKAIDAGYAMFRKALIHRHVVPRFRGVLTWLSIWHPQSFYLSNSL